MLGEEFLRQAAYLDIVAAQAAEIFDEHCRRFAQLKLGNHVLVARPVHRNAGDAVVEEVNEVGVAFFLGDLGQQLFLRRDLSRLFSPAEYKCPTLL